ncbi:hypothetical protein ACN28G_05630 [Micromonospora sp. WMMA1923]|uniref:hypothetical protein n=1 Tax=Micromonospora sp. WMMA1923 TaxID=3404125 RepID=UPI003B944F7D
MTHSKSGSQQTYDGPSHNYGNYVQQEGEAAPLGGDPSQTQLPSYTASQQDLQMSTLYQQAFTRPAPQTRTSETRVPNYDHVEFEKKEMERRTTGNLHWTDPRRQITVDVPSRTLTDSPAPMSASSDQNPYASYAGMRVPTGSGTPTTGSYASARSSANSFHTAYSHYSEASLPSQSSRAAQPPQNPQGGNQQRPAGRR